MIDTERRSAIWSPTRYLEQTEYINDLDFDFVPTCEHTHHNTEHVADQPAKYFIHHQCPDCGRNKYLYICESGWRNYEHGVTCARSHRRYPRGQAMTILEVLS